MKYKIKQFMKADISKFYILGVGIICLLLIGGFFSYAMFTVSKEKSNAIRIVTGNLTYKLTVDGTEGNTLTVGSVDGTEGNTLTVGSKETKTFTVTLSNNNNRTARFNFYYVGSFPSDVTAGYVTGDGLNTPPAEAGINLEKADASGSSNTYSIRVSNNSSSSATITLGVSVGLDYNDLTLPENGHLFEESKLEGPVADVIKMNIGENGAINTTDPDQTFITGTDPNNYIWYSGKLWRAVSIDPSDNSVKLVTQWNISAIPYNASGNPTFEGSYMQDWLNDTTVDGFLGNLRDYENFIKTDSVWNATLTTSTSKPESTTMVTDAVGILNIYEYTMSYSGTDSSNGYLNNGLDWWTLTPYSTSIVHSVSSNGSVFNNDFPSNANGARPSINLKSSVRIVSGDGTKDNPYRLNGDNDTNLSGTMLNTRYSGEYIRFGTGENNLYRIVSHENGTNTTFSSTNTVGSFLNNDYLNTGNGYLTDEDIAMIEDSTTWYLGTVEDGISYKLAKYTNVTDNILTSSTTTAKVGLLRLGELMSGQFDRYGKNANYWTITPYSTSAVRGIINNGRVNNYILSNALGVRPSINLKSNVQIVNGDGTLNSPFEIQLGS